MHIDSKITDLSAFKHLDKETFETVENQFRESMENIKEANEHQIIIELYKQQIICLNSMDYYRKILMNLQEKDRELLEYSKEIFKSSIDYMFDRIYFFLNSKKEKIIYEIEKEFVWYQGVKDAIFKSAKIINVSKKIINNTLDKVNINKSITLDDIDTRALIEKLLEKHMNNECIVNFLDKTIQETIAYIVDEWNKRISKQIEAIYKKEESIINGLEYKKIMFEIDSAGQIFITGISSAVIGTIGLAAGWHTLTYALLNVFPPIAIFTAVATIASGVYNKDKAKERLIKQVEDIFDEYRKQIIFLIDEEKFTQLNNMSIYDYLQFLCNGISNQCKENIKNMYINIDNNKVYEIISAYEEHMEFISLIING